MPSKTNMKEREKKKKKRREIKYGKLSIPVSYLLHCILFQEELLVIYN